MMCDHTPRPLQAMVVCNLRERLVMRPALITKPLNTDGSFDLCGYMRTLSREGRMS